MSVTALFAPADDSSPTEEHSALVKQLCPLLVGKFFNTSAKETCARWAALVAKAGAKQTVRGTRGGRVIGRVSVVVCGPMCAEQPPRTIPA